MYNQYSCDISVHAICVWIYLCLCRSNVVGIYLCMPYDVALCTINVVGIYLCIPYDVALCTINVVGIYLWIHMMWLYVQSM